MTEALGLDKDGNQIVAPVTPVTPVVPTPDQTAEIATLKAQLGEATERINKYDGERKDAAEQTNLVTGLTEQVAALTTKLQETENEDTKHESVTQEELRTYKAGESDRFATYNKTEKDKVTANEKLYQEELGKVSLTVKDETLFDAICKEHDALVANGTMPESTGNMKIDAQLAWKEAENSHFRKQLAAGKQIPFEKDPAKVTTPVVPGTKELGTSTETQTTTMPSNLPADAQEFIEMMGDTNNPDKINAALGIK